MSTRQVKVSIIIPVYNGAKYIKRCLRSIVEQKGFSENEIEIVIIDDGSVDNSAQVVKDFAHKHSCIHYYHQKNAGQGAARNAGIQKSRGKYITFIDQDDFIDSDFLTTFYSAAEDNASDVVIGGYRRVSRGGGSILRIVVRNLHGFFPINNMSVWSKLYRRQFIIENALELPQLALGEDIAFSVTLFNLYPNVTTVTYVGYNWFYNPTSFSNKNQRSLSENTSRIIALQDYVAGINKTDRKTEAYVSMLTPYILFFSGKPDNDKTFNREMKLAMSHLRTLYPHYLSNPKFWFMFAAWNNKVALFSKAFLSLYRLRLSILLVKSRHLIRGL